MVEASDLGFSITRRFENLRATMVLGRPTVIVPGSESRHSTIYIHTFGNRKYCHQQSGYEQSQYSGIAQPAHRDKIVVEQGKYRRARSCTYVPNRHFS